MSKFQQLLRTANSQQLKGVSDATLCQLLFSKSVCEADALVGSCLHKYGG